VDDPEAARVIREAAYERGCDFYDASQTKPTDVTKSLDGYSFKGFSFAGAPFPVELKMIGMHQVYNAICALTVIEVLAERGIINIDLIKVRKGRKGALQQGHLENLSRKLLLIIDRTHNEAGVKSLTRVVEYHFQDKKILLFIGI